MGDVKPKSIVRAKRVYEQFFKLLEESNTRADEMKNAINSGRRLTEDELDEVVNKHLKFEREIKKLDQTIKILARKESEEYLHIYVLNARLPLS